MSGGIKDYPAVTLSGLLASAHYFFHSRHHLASGSIEEELRVIEWSGSGGRA